MHLRSVDENTDLFIIEVFSQLQKKQNPLT